ncbi:hypothetical protein [Sedimentisphaera salicampi]|uniref:Type II secretion system protein GspC N-terminal domain-containing protein n=1 Tax=Sedimentisphaera salicampi TaxID=1941349 RepID=A0A1W6LPW2_9BACT|nr:hypothetical protein [Sedimentisphaera salicampi]ARN57838.1 hypothetical protein STSP1_02264 [Sedimentisphaera salicampi]OXU14006.1 hypothetical protein SMSP1_02168 [Sedimentisphaera salicampi]
MLRLFQIFSFLVLISSVVMAVMLIKKPAPESEKVQEFLANASVAEEFKAKADTSNSDQNSESALVKAARQYTKEPEEPQPNRNISRSNTNPRPKNNTPDPQPKKQQEPKPPSPIKVRFTLEGTCVNEDRPELSMAFVDLPGEGKKWVYQGQTVGHLRIRKINEDSIYLDNNGSVSELEIKEHKSSIKNILESVAPAEKQVSSSSSQAPLEKPQTQSQQNTEQFVPQAEDPLKEMGGLPPGASPEQLDDLREKVRRMNEDAAEKGIRGK